MIFTSFEFVAFFATLLLLSGLLRNFNAKTWLLLIASWLFYMSWSVPCVLLILFTSLLDWFIARKLAQTTDASRRKNLLVTSLTMSLGLLAFFKYSNFFLDNLGELLRLLGANVTLRHYSYILPPAISFYTFSSMGYVLDVYYERTPVCQSARDYTLFTAFFPKLLSGPIVKAGEMLPQIKERLRITAEEAEIGLSYCLIGAVKKMVVADQIAPHVNLIFSAPAQYDGPTLLVGLMGYAVQIYCDFSGYSDMAIGFARILGFRLPENFQMPYSASSITEFWRRWHMTLSKWFRDYVFLPLEIATRGNPYPNVRVSINILAMMLLVGLWHGPSWNYVIFGGIHGLALVIHKLWTGWRPLELLKKHVVGKHAWTVCAHLLTLGVALLGFVFFRTPTFAEAMSYLGRLLHWQHGGTRLDSPYIAAAVGAVLLAHLLIRKDRNLALELPGRSMPLRIACYTALFLLLVLLGATDSSPFIYFQF